MVQCISADGRGSRSVRSVYVDFLCGGRGHKDQYSNCRDAFKK